MRAARVVLVVAAWLGAAAPARGGECTVRTVHGEPALAAIDAGVRLQFIRERLAADARRARIWTWSWSGIYAGLVVGQLAPMPWLDKGTREDLAVGSGGALLGLVPLLVMPLEVIADTRWLERRLATAPPGTGECQLLAEAEGLLHRDAKGEAFGRSWLFHVGNVVVNVALGLVIAAGFHHWLSGGISSAVGIAVGEAQILTQPTGAVTALARYRRGDLGPAPASAPAAPVISLAPLAAPRAAGIALAIGF